MRTVDIPKLRRNQIAVVIHHPASAGHYEAHSEVVVVNNRGNWLSRAEGRAGEDVRLYDDGTAYLGQGAYSRAINGSWESFTAKQMADRSESVRVDPVA